LTEVYLISLIYQNLDYALLDFIINYDIKYRMGDALAGDEDGE
jgi:hypothetical protein